MNATRDLINVSIDYLTDDVLRGIVRDCQAVLDKRSELRFWHYLNQHEDEYRDQPTVMFEGKERENFIRTRRITAEAYRAAREAQATA